MKTYIGLITGLLIILSSSVFAESMVVTQTSNWRSVPITVDPSNHTYTVVGTVPTDTTDYYYSYSGYRCFREKRDIAGVTALTFTAGVSGGSDIYCYPET